MESNRILFLCGQYSSPSAANSICVKNLAEEVIKLGYEPFVLARGAGYKGVYEEINGVKVWKIKGDTFGRVVSYFEQRKSVLLKLLFSIIQFIRYSYVLWIYPITSKRDLARIKKWSKRIIEENNINIVTATYGPYETIQAAVYLKKRYKSNLKVVTYHLDLLTNPSNESSIISRLKKHRASRAMIDEFATVDRVLLPMTAPVMNDPKFQYVDFPLYITSQTDTYSGRKYFSGDSINIAIAGSLDKYNRNPLLFCRIIDKMPDICGKRVVLHIWGNTVGIDFSGYKNIEYHGMASVEEVPVLLQQCDFLFNVGNKTSYRMLPSKIFQMFAAKKPIIFLYSSPLDKSIPYFKKYGYTLFLPEFDGDFNKNLEKVSSFIKQYYGKSLNISDTMFETSTPSYIAKKLITI